MTIKLGLSMDWINYNHLAAFIACHAMPAVTQKMAKKEPRHALDVACELPNTTSLDTVLHGPCGTAPTHALSAKAVSALSVNEPCTSQFTWPETCRPYMTSICMQLHQVPNRNALLIRT